MSKLDDILFSREVVLDAIKKQAVKDLFLELARDVVMPVSTMEQLKEKIGEL